MASRCRCWTSRSPYHRMATALLNSTKSQPRNHYLSTISQPCQPNPNLTSFATRGKRIEDRCPSKTSTKQHLGAFDDILRLNGYPENSIEQAKCPQNLQRNSQPTGMEWSYLKIPYISERLNHKITNIFRKENISVRVAHKSYTLRQAIFFNSAVFFLFIWRSHFKFFLSKYFFL